MIFPEGKAYVDESSRAMFGRVLKPHEWATLAGAPDKAHVVVSRADAERIYVSWRTSEGSAERSIHKHYIYNEIFTAEQSGGGLGLRAFGRQVEFASKLGFSKIKTEAAKSDYFVGYKVWPKLGYDGPVSAYTKSVLPKQFSKATKISDLMRSQKGREAWAEHGEQTHMTFDLTKGSYSQRVLAAYTKRKLGGK